MAAPDGPPLLFKLGHLRPEDDQAVTVAGTREPSPASEELAKALGRELAAGGLTVVSGLALGVDAAAYQGALDAGGRKLAVLGSGLRMIHSARNRCLAHCIKANGAILSELHPSTPPKGRQLMACDRIISGLGLACVIMEGATAGADGLRGGRG